MQAAPLNKQDVQKTESQGESKVEQLQPVKTVEPVKVQPVVVPVAQAPVPPKPQPARVEPQVTVAGCGDNTYANYIYMHESGCRPTAMNSIGCRGIGQACPGSKLPCGDDYACQNAWFTNYALTRYGSWEKAYHFWLQNHWW